MKPGKVRPLAICVVRDGGRIFAAEGRDSVKDEVFYRPLGGSIEFGERGSETVVREFGEEIGAQVTNVRYLGTLENIFTYEGEQGHEIVLVYEGDFADESLYEKPSVEGHEGRDKPFLAVWKPLALFRRGQAPLYPEGLLGLLDKADDNIH